MWGHVSKRADGPPSKPSAGMSASLGPDVIICGLPSSLAFEPVLCGLHAWTRRTPKARQQVSAPTELCARALGRSTC